MEDINRQMDFVFKNVEITSIILQVNADAWMVWEE